MFLFILNLITNGLCKAYDYFNYNQRDSSYYIYNTLFYFISFISLLYYYIQTRRKLSRVDFTLSIRYNTLVENHISWYSKIQLSNLFIVCFTLLCYFAGQTLIIYTRNSINNLFGLFYDQLILDVSYYLFIINIRPRKNELFCKLLCLDDIKISRCIINKGSLYEYAKSFNDSLCINKTSKYLYKSRNVFIVINPSFSNKLTELQKKQKNDIFLLESLSIGHILSNNKN